MIKEIILSIITLIIVGAIALNYMSFKQWLVYACTEAEKALGSGTGQLKLKYAYDLAIKTFPIIAKFIPFNFFSKMVDKALVIMKNMIEQNKNIAEVIESKVNSEEK